MKTKGLLFVGIGFELVVIVLGGVFVGQHLDKWLNWPGYGTAAIVIVLLIAWFHRLITLLKRLEKND